MTTIKTAAVCGATGFVGRAIVRELVTRGVAVRALARDRAKALRVLPREGVTLIWGDVLDAATAAELVRGADACVNAVGILREDRTPGHARTFEKLHVHAVRGLVRACEQAGVRRFVQISALGVRHTGVCEYQRSKWEGELAVRRSTLDWTVLRPGLIHGPESDFLRVAKKLVSGQSPPWVFIPYFCREEEDKRVPLGSVRHVDPMVAPVAVEDVARAVAAALANDATIGEIYNLVGSETLSWPAMLSFYRDTLPGANGELEPHAIPSSVAALAAWKASLLGLGGLLPFDEGMARMGAEDAVASLDKARTDLGIDFKPFRASAAAYASRA